MPTVSAAGRCCCGPRVAVISSSPREIRAQPDLAAFAAGEITPGPACRSDAAIDAHIRATAISVHHPLGTCKMELRRDRRLVECCLFRKLPRPLLSSIHISFLGNRCVYTPDIEGTRGAHDSAEASDRHHFGGNCGRDNRGE